MMLLDFRKDEANWFQQIPLLWSSDGKQTTWGGLLLYSIIVLTITTILSGIIGYEREKNGYAAGFRTHILVALGACLFMIVSKYGFQDIDYSGDPARIAAQVVAGVGFIGAGVIMKNGLEIKGLTTSTTLWIVAAIGMCAGTGLVFEAVVATIIAVIVLVVLKFLERKFRKNSVFIAYLVPREQMTLAKVSTICDEMNIQIRDIDISKDVEGNNTHTRIVLTIKAKEHIEVEQLIERINQEIEPLKIEEIK